MLFSEIQSKIEHAPELDFGQILNESIELFKKVWLQGLLMTLITMACSIPFMAIVYVPMLFLGIADATDSGNFDSLEPVATAILGVAYVVAIVLMAIVAFGLQSSFFRIIATKDFNLADKEDYFFFLKIPYLEKTIKLAILSIFIAIIAMLLCVLPLFYAMVPLSLIYAVYALNPNLSVSEITKTSFELGNKKWLITFGLIIVAGMLAQLVGFMLCCIGLLVTTSFTQLPIYIIYKKVIGFEASQVEEIGVRTI